MIYKIIRVKLKSRGEHIVGGGHRGGGILLVKSFARETHRGESNLFVHAFYLIFPRNP